MQNGYCTTKYFRIEVGNNNNIHNRCIFWLVALRSELIKNEWKFLKLSKVLYQRIQNVVIQENRAEARRREGTKNPQNSTFKSRYIFWPEKVGGCIIFYRLVIVFNTTLYLDTTGLVALFSELLMKCQNSDTYFGIQSSAQVHA